MELSGVTAEAGNVTYGVHPNELPTGTAPEDPVQLPDFTVIDSTGSDFSLDKLQVICTCASHCSWSPLENQDII